MSPPAASAPASAGLGRPAAEGGGVMRGGGVGATSRARPSEAALFANATYQVARKEFLQHLRTKRLLIVLSITTFLLIVVTAFFGPQITKHIPQEVTSVISKEHIVLAFYFAVGLIGGLQFAQLLSIVLTSDAVCSEWSQRTIFLLLSKPVSRVAFVTGKFLGNLFTVSSSLLVLFILTYIIMQPIYSTSPTGNEVLGFFGMLGMVVLGSAAFSAISLFFSTITKSTVMSLLCMLGMWLIVFPVIGLIGLFQALGNDRVDFDSAQVQFWLYLNPAACMQSGAKLLVPNEEAQRAVGFLQAANPFATAPNDVGIAALCLLGFTVVFFLLSVLVVKRRNFE